VTTASLMPAQDRLAPERTRLAWQYWYRVRSTGSRPRRGIASVPSRRCSTTRGTDYGSPAAAAADVSHCQTSEGAAKLEPGNRNREPIMAVSRTAIAPSFFDFWARSETLPRWMTVPRALPAGVRLSLVPPKRVFVDGPSYVRRRLLRMGTTSTEGGYSRLAAATCGSSLVILPCRILPAGRRQAVVSDLIKVKGNSNG
jgi:hypothetical protein